MMQIADFINVPVFASRDEEFKFIFDRIKVAGLLMEFGVWRGESINKIARCSRGQTVWGFDSFKGLPESWGRKHRNHALPRPPKVADNVQLVVGLFEDMLASWKQMHPGPISLLNLDADLYSSTIFVLNELNDRIVPGTIIRFDELSDWRLVAHSRTHRRGLYHNWRDHEWKALNEWLAKYDRKVVPMARNMTWGATMRVVA